MGATVTAISRSDSKREQALGFGAKDFLVSTNDDDMAARAMTFDVLLNTVSGIDDLSKYFNLLVPGGVMAVVGLPEKTKPLGLYLQSIVVSSDVEMRCRCPPTLIFVLVFTAIGNRTSAGWILPGHQCRIQRNVEIFRRTRRPADDRGCSCRKGTGEVSTSWQWLCRAFVSAHCLCCL